MKVHNGQQKLNLWNYWSMIEILTQRIFHSKINVIYCYIILHKQCTQYFCSVDKNNTTLQSRSWTVSMRANITHAKRPCCLVVNRCVQLATDVQNWWHEGCWARPDQTDCSRPPSTCTKVIHMALSFNDFTATREVLSSTWQTSCHFSVTVYVCLCICVCVCGLFLSMCQLPRLLL